MPRLAARKEPMRHVPFVCLALCTFTASPMLAQAPSAWTTLSPPGGVDAAKLTFGETVAVYRDGDYMRSYSAITRKWHPHTPSFGTSLFVSDHLAVTPESDRWTAFSTHRGSYETLFVDFATTTWELTDTMMLVRDGATLHVFSTFTGEWHSHAVPSTWQRRVEQRIAVFSDYVYTGVSDGGVIFDATTGAWIDIPSAGERLVATTGPGSVLISRTTHCLGYSTQRATLETLPAPVLMHGNTFGPAPQEMLVDDGVAWSGLSGALTQPPYPPPNPWYFAAGFGYSGLVVRAHKQDDPEQYVLGMDGAWIQVPTGAITDGGGRSFIVYRDGADRHAFSVLSNQWASHTFDGDAGAVDNKGDVAVRTNLTDQHPWLFSALTGQWHEAPADVVPSTPPFGNMRLANDGAVLPTTSGLLGFSAQDATFTPIAAAGATRFGDGSVLGGYDAGNVYLFDAGRSHWQTIPFATAAAPSIRDDTMLVDDGTQALGYSGASGRAEQFSPTDAIVARGNQGRFAWLRTASSVHTFSAVPEHFAQTGAALGPATARGTLQRHQLQLDTGDVALFTLGPRAATAIPTVFGELWLDPTQVAMELVVQLGGEQRVMFEYAIPDVPALRGSRWFVQPLMLRAGGVPYLADSQAFLVF